MLQATSGPLRSLSATSVGTVGTASPVPAEHPNLHQAGRMKRGSEDTATKSRSPPLCPRLAQGKPAQTGQSSSQAPSRRLTVLCEARGLRW